MLKIILLLCVCVFVSCEKRECVHEINGEKGVCVPFKDCPSATTDLKFKIYPQFCAPVIEEVPSSTPSPVTICCLDGGIRNLTGLRFLAAKNSTTKDQNGCPGYPFLNKKTNETIAHRQKAIEKCLEFQSKIELPCEDGGFKLVPQCADHRSLIVGGGGIDAEEHQFPHMALLGYGKNFSSANFYCGGSLISERFILTAAHCSALSGGEPVRWAIFGTLRRDDVPKAPADFIRQIMRIIGHPDYKPPSTYNDIALLEMDREIQSRYEIRPACLHVGNEVYDSRAYATGWGALGHRADYATILQNVPLWKVADETCKKKFPPHRKYKRGIDNTIQMCYGSDGIPRDTCSGDSGGPLQIRHTNIFCTYLILGVTSFGNSFCAQVGHPGIYTRVSHYVPWIEGIVWP